MINPFLLKITSFTLIILDSLMYPISFATRNTSAEVSSLTPFLWFKALEMVAGENPVRLLISFILTFITKTIPSKFFYKFLYT